MISEEYVVFMMLLVMFYLLHKYPKFMAGNVIYISLIPYYVVANFSNMALQFNLFVLFITISLNLYYIEANRSNSEF